MSSRITFDDLDDLDDFDNEPAPAPSLLGVNPDPLAMAISGGTGINEAKYTENCKHCRGSGNFYSYNGRLVGDCFRCKGTGKQTYRTSKETREKARKTRAKRAQTKQAASMASMDAWCTEHPGALDYLVKRAPTWEFAASLLAGLKKWGSLTEKQWAVLERMMTKDRVEAEQEKQAESRKDGLDISNLPTGMYAVPNGETRLKVRVSRPRKDSRWYGTIFVDDGAAYGNRTSYGRQSPGKLYVGKIEDALLAIMEDPHAAMVAYGRLTGHCGACGRLLEDEESVARGIGPVCAKKFA